MRLAVFNHLLTLHPHYFEINRSGEINARLTTDTTLLQSIFGFSISMALSSVLLFLGGLVMMLITNLKLALIVLVTVPIILLPMAIYGRRLRALSRKSQDTVADIGTYAGEIVQNIKVVQSFTREPEESIAFKNEVEKAFSAAKRRIMQSSLLIAAAMILVFTGLGAMIWFGAKDVTNGDISAGELASFVFYAIMGMYGQDNTNYYDLGSSTGAITLSIALNNKSKNNQFFAIDNSKEMVEQCEKNLHNKVDNLQAICDDINQVKINSASIVVLNLTLQFIDVNLRSNLIKKIYDGLESGGILIISEKIHFDDAVTQNQITKLHMDFKKENGYSELEIANKRQAIENVLITETKEQHLNRLRDCGFVETSCFFQCLNFVSFLSVK